MSLGAKIGPAETPALATAAPRPLAAPGGIAGLSREIAALGGFARRSATIAARDRAPAIPAFAVARVPFAEPEGRFTS